MFRSTVLAAAGLAAGFSTMLGCGSRQPTAAPSTVTPPANAVCVYSIPSDDLTVRQNAEEFEASFAITTSQGCSWTAVSQAEFLTVTSGASGSGNGSVHYRVAANAGAERRGALAVAGQTVTVIQTAVEPCEFSVTPMTITLPFAGLSGSLAVTKTKGTGSCAWTATSQAGFLRITDGASGSGNGTVQYTGDANSGSSRQALVLVAGRTVTISQDGAPQPEPCQFTVAPLSISASVASQTGTIDVKQTRGPASCAWTATTADGFIAISSGAAGTGHGVVSYAIAANAGAGRSGTIKVAGATVAVSQAGAPAPPPPPPAACAFSVTPAQASLPATGGNATFAVTVTQGQQCAWTTTIEDAALTLVSGGSGVGSGAVVVNLGLNAGQPRTPTLTIAGTRVSVSQVGPTNCVTAVTPMGVTSQVTGQTLSVNVSAPATCVWIPTSNVPFITVTSTARSGDGLVSFTVAPNTTGTIRFGNIIVANFYVGVIQSAF